MIDVLKATFREFSEDSCTRLAAALAYFTVFALAPLLYLLLLILGLYYQATGQGGDETARAQVDQQIEAIVGPAASEQVQELVARAGNQQDGGPWRWIIGIGAVLVGATGLVVALQDTLNEAWGVGPDPEQGGIKNFVLKRLLSLGMIFGIAFLLLVSTMLSFLIQKIIGAGLAFVSDLVTLVVVTVLFAAMFKYLPDAIVRWKDVFVGAAVTALLFGLGRYGLTIYLSHADFSQFGAAASLAVLLVWVYYSSLILLLGAEFTQVWARRYGNGIQPAEGAVRLPGPGGAKSSKAASLTTETNSPALSADRTA